MHGSVDVAKISGGAEVVISGGDIFHGRSGGRGGGGYGIDGSVGKQQGRERIGGDNISLLNNRYIS